jgi:RNA polymerase sigma-70 factor (ECF subfamily)
MTFRSKDGGGFPEISLELQGVNVPARAEPAQRVEQLYHEYHDSVYRYLLLTGSSPADADEFAQEAFLRLFRSFRSGQTIEKPKSWLVTVAHNLRLHEGQKEDRKALVSETQFTLYAAMQVDPGLDPETAMLERERLDHVRLAMGRLTVRQSEYLNLRAEGLKLREIAEMYGVAVQSVAETCSRALERLGKFTHE